MYTYILNMWIMRRVTELQVEAFRAKGLITRDEVETIISTPQVAG